VNTPARPSPTLVSYQLRLPVFEGPFDVLLRLIEREQLSISDVSLLAVFDQFMQFVRALETPHPELVAEFAAVAGRLSLLKSRSLLPRSQKSTDEPEALDMVRQLEEYRAVKAAAELLAARHRSGAGTFGRGDGVAMPDSEPVRLTPQPSHTLANAVNRWVTRLQAIPSLVVLTHAVSLREMTSRILSMLDGSRSMSFDRVRAGCAGRHDVAVAFLALLTLLRGQSVIVTQRDVFGAILIERPLSIASVAPDRSELTGAHGNL
jgi:segregation and condensation protein A